MGISTFTMQLQRCTTKNLLSLKFIRNSHNEAIGKLGRKVATRQCEEIQIKVPWGHLSAKWWGSQTVRPILGLHGWQDNAGTFDTLAPLLPDHVGFLAIDLPGHGLSSRLPNGIFYSRVDGIHIILTLMKEFKWDKVSLLGHSMSSSIGFLFSAVFPDKIDMMVGIDMLKPYIHPAKLYVDRLPALMEGFLIADERNRQLREPPSYTYEECIERMYIGSEKSVDKDKCSYILDRNIEKSIKFPGKYYFNRDGRLKFYNFDTFYHELCLEMASQITTPYLYIKASRGVSWEHEKYYIETVDVMKKSNPKFEYYVVDGLHHVHLNEPEKITGLVNNFIDKHRAPASV